MYEKFGKIGWPSTLVVLLLMVGLLFGVAGPSFAEENISVSVQATGNGVQFSVQGEGVESFQLNVFTASGRSVFKSGSARNNSVTWNLTDASGNRVPFGIYLYRFAGKSTTGEVRSSGVAKIFVGPNQVTAETVESRSLSDLKKGNKGKPGPSKCTTIQDGTLTYSTDHYLEEEPLMTGYDPYGYNYQGHMFKGSYANAYLGSYGFPPYKGNDDAYLEEYPSAEGTWVWPYRNTKLLMKWNDAWLSNKDCDDDGKLDRHYDHDSYIGSGAWETNHMSGGKGKDKWTYFTKIIAVPKDATLTDGTWYTFDGTKIGPVIWDQFATVQTVESGEGAIYVSPSGPGFGKWKE